MIAYFAPTLLVLVLFALAGRVRHHIEPACPGCSSRQWESTPSSMACGSCGWSTSPHVLTEQAAA